MDSAAWHEKASQADRFDHDGGRMRAFWKICVQSRCSENIDLLQCIESYSHAVINISMALTDPHSRNFGYDHFEISNVYRSLTLELKIFIAY
jgi:hypothetical protein